MSCRPCVVASRVDTVPSTACLCRKDSPPAYGVTSRKYCKSGQYSFEQSPHGDASLAVASVIALQGGAAAVAPALLAQCKDKCAPRFGKEKRSCSDTTTGSCGVGARVELQDLAAAHAAPHNGRPGTITAVGDRFQVDFDAGGTTAQWGIPSYPSYTIWCSNL